MQLTPRGLVGWTILVHTTLWAHVDSQTLVPNTRLSPQPFYPSQTGQFTWPAGESTGSFSEGAEMNISWATTYPAINLWLIANQSWAEPISIISNSGASSYVWTIACGKDCSVPFLLRAVTAEPDRDEQEHGGFYSRQFWINPSGDGNTMSPNEVSSTKDSSPTTSESADTSSSRATQSSETTQDSEPTNSSKTTSSSTTTSDAEPTSSSEPASNTQETSTSIKTSSNSTTVSNPEHIPESSESASPSNSNTITPNPSTTQDSTSDNKWMTLGTGIGVGLGVALCLAAGYMFWRRTRRRTKSARRSSDSTFSPDGPKSSASSAPSYTARSHSSCRAADDKSPRSHYAELTGRRTLQEMAGFRIEPQELAGSGYVEGRRREAEC